MAEPGTPQVGTPTVGTTSAVGFQNQPVTLPQVKVDGGKLPDGGAGVDGSAANIITRQQGMAEWSTIGNFAGQTLNMLSDAWKTSLQVDLMNRVMDLQMTQVSKFYENQGKVVALQEHLSDNGVQVAVKNFETVESIASLQKDRDIAVAKAKGDAAVKIARINALNSQFYGQPVQQTSLLG